MAAVILRVFRFGPAILCANHSEIEGYGKSNIFWWWRGRGVPHKPLGAHPR